MIKSVKQTKKKEIAEKLSCHSVSDFLNNVEEKSASCFWNDLWISCVSRWQTHTKWAAWILNFKCPLSLESAFSSSPVYGSACPNHSMPISHRLCACFQQSSSPHIKIGCFKLNEKQQQQQHNTTYIIGYKPSKVIIPTWWYKKGWNFERDIRSQIQSSSSTVTFRPTSERTAE